ncbi:hypothetical protein FVR03_03620 [Pontibacter qinzhouensis]|uniref:Uncharacterized protein n=1 Tax=Pontibacter qinzhouensis TaxID=2603253 RepID=A0A5C8KE83_9BACT|nr:hypothetical protein [Pontibacter qinzhouensis]TXK51310.1 hypothetical protein FVR03_03620 [Pontibacter qinzhouensis]
MKIPVIKKLVETQSIETLLAAEAAILEEQELAIEVEGEDEGEQLTHILAAVWILNQMHHQHVDFKTALREYTQKVRTSIS